MSNEIPVFKYCHIYSHQSINISVASKDNCYQFHSWSHFPFLGNYHTTFPSRRAWLDSPKSENTTTLLTVKYMLYKKCLIFGVSFATTSGGSKGALINIQIRKQDIITNFNNNIWLLIWHSIQTNTYCTGKCRKVITLDSKSSEEWLSCMCMYVLYWKDNMANQHRTHLYKRSLSIPSLSIQTCFFGGQIVQLWALGINLWQCHLKYPKRKGIIFESA